MSGSNICFFVPRRWRVAVFAVVLLMFAYLLLEPMIKSNLPIDVGCEYEIKDVIVTPESLGVGHCPICFGRNESICEGVIHNTVRLRRKKRASLGDKWKPKALGILNKDRISIKHLGNISEFHKLDNELCSMVGTVNAPCENDVVRKPFLNLSSIESVMKETMYCPSERFISKVKNIYIGEKLQKSQTSLRTLQLTSTLYVNQEPIIFQVFPSEKGWPFPKFYGACGRVIIVEDAGLPLDYFLSYPWIERAKLALAVIKIAKQLSNNPEDWGLYMTEIALDNFAVSNGTVKLEDADGILVADLSGSGIKAEREKTVDVCDWEETNCLSSHPAELCRGVIRDQNYYAVCRSVLSDIGSGKGLLHSPPEEGDFNNLLQEALTECVTAQTLKRKEALDLVVSLLQKQIET